MPANLLIISQKCVCITAITSIVGIALNFMYAIYPKQNFWHDVVIFDILCCKIPAVKYVKRRTMNTLIDSLQQKLQDLTNRVELIKKQLDSFSPTLNDDETLSSLVARLQTDVGDLKLKVSNFDSNITSLNNTYSTIVANVENNTFDIQNLQSVDANTEQEINNLKTTDQTLSQQINNNSQLIAGNNQNIAFINNELEISNSKITANTQLSTANETAIANLSITVDELIASVDYLNSHINNYISSNSPADNELYFIVNGTYVAESDVDAIVNGTYTGV